MAAFEIGIMFGIPGLPAAPTAVWKRRSFSCCCQWLAFLSHTCHVEWSQLCFGGSFKTEPLKLSPGIKWFKLFREKSCFHLLNPCYCLLHSGFSLVSQGWWCLPCKAEEARGHGRRPRGAVWIYLSTFCHFPAAQLQCANYSGRQLLKKSKWNIP